MWTNLNNLLPQSGVTMFRIIPLVLLPPSIFVFFSFPLLFLVCPHLNAYIYSDVIHCSLTLLYGGNLSLSLFSLYTDPINIVQWAKKNNSQNDKTHPPPQWHPQPLSPLPQIVITISWICVFKHHALSIPIQILPPRQSMTLTPTCT